MPGSVSQDSPMGAKGNRKAARRNVRTVRRQDSSEDDRSPVGLRGAGSPASEDHVKQEPGVEGSAEALATGNDTNGQESDSDEIDEENLSFEFDPQLDEELDEDDDMHTADESPPPPKRTDDPADGRIIRRNRWDS
jgi:hypothetical protein